MDHFDVPEIFIPKPIETIPIELQPHHCAFGSYSSAFIDMDYYGWKYQLPSTDEYVVMLSNFIEVYIDSYNELCECHDPELHIRDWHNFGDTEVACNYEHTILIFPRNYTYEQILFCSKDYMRNHYWQRNINVNAIQTKIQNHLLMLDQSFVIQNDLDYAKPIIFDMRDLIIKNASEF